MSENEKQKREIKKALNSFRASFHRALAEKRSVVLPAFPVRKYMTDDFIQKSVSVVKTTVKHKLAVLTVLLLASLFCFGILYFSDALFCKEAEVFDFFYG